ncbi:TPA: 30S ribosomal protein S7 [Candidatus Poribacteria bacterium]|nr:30S ribosomal protein S7 [Candidatus Poribacteria bacterium]HEX30007.1 30S ribosomal protein S7 [Candidatus Poribacteria bacterium]
MPRRKIKVKREIAPDPRYNSVLVAKFINKLMREGKKSLAQRIFYESLEIVGKRTGEDPLQIFFQAVENVKPVLEVRTRRVGGANYQVPVEVRPERQVHLALKWIIDSARARFGRSMQEKLAAEILDAYRNEGAAIKKKQDTHRMAEANRAFAHYRW